MATLVPITWREPFGLVMIESMATGTPVIAMELGSTPEVIVHGHTGFLCRTVDRVYRGDRSSASVKSLCLPRACNEKLQHAAHD